MVIGDEKATILWDKLIHRVRGMKANRADIFIRYHQVKNKLSISRISKVR